MSCRITSAAGALVALGLSACALTGAERSPSLLDPSNPEAPASPVRPLTALSGAPRATPTPVPPASDGGTSAPAAYVCPMHPDVTAHAPSRCPRCGMKLVASPRGTP